MKDSIDRNSFTPIYYQLSELIKDEIHSGRRSPGEQLLPEDKLAAFYGVSRNTIKQVLDKLSKEGYVHRQKGRGTFIKEFKSKKHVIVAVVLASLASEYHRSISDMLSGILVGASPQGYELRVNTSDQLSAILDDYNAGKSDVSGMILLRYRDNMENYLDDIIKSGMPFIIEGRDVKHASYVSLDNRYAMRHAVEYLYNLGHQNIGMLSLKKEFGRVYDVRKKAAIEAIEDVCGECNLSYCFDFANGGYSEIKNEMKQVLSQADLPSAFVAASDIIALAFSRQAREMGFNIPGDFSIIGFDDLPEIKFERPGITTFKYDYYQLGLLSAEKLIESISDFKNRKVKLDFKPDFIERESCAKSAK